MITSTCGSLFRVVVREPLLPIATFMPHFLYLSSPF
jgi:hypothetical protein